MFLELKSKVVELSNMKVELENQMMLNKIMFD